MATNIVATNIRLRYGTYTQWMNSRNILLKGEVAVVEFPSYRVIDRLSNSIPDNTPPAIGLKVGNGVDYFRDLPWIQAISADVYQWAKSPSKPTYNANEISGLDDYISTYSGGGSGGGTSVSRQYQIVEGTGANANKYYLQYKNDDSDTWVTDTSHYVDLTEYAALRSWIGPANVMDVAEGGYRDLRSYIGFSLLQPIIQGLAKSDSVVANQFVTAVSETDGVITVSRRQPAFTDISGVATIEQGGTGTNSLPEGEVLVGNGTGALRSIPIATSITDEYELVPSYIIKRYVEQLTAGLSGAMHYVDAPGVIITTNPNTGALIVTNLPEDYRPAAGDVIAAGQQEYLFTGSSWRLFGDEGSYAIRGSITDADISSEAAIQMTKISNLIATLNLKVDKEEGKGLSTNDYSNEEKQKLASIEAEAQVNTIEHVFLNNTEMHPTTISSLSKSVDLHVKEFDDASRQKLGTIQEGAQVNSIEIISKNGTDLPISNQKKVNIEVNEITEAERNKLEGIAEGAQVNVIETINFNGKAVPIDNKKTVSLEWEDDPHTEHINKIESIFVNGTEQVPNGQKQVHLTLTKATLGLTSLEGALVPNGSGTEAVQVDANKNLLLARVAKTGLIQDLLQESNTYIVISCGTSTTVI